jgi:hypothetical protein
MESNVSGVFEWVMSALVWYSTPLVATAISVAYFLRSGADVSSLRRVATSAHGVVIAVLYVVAMLVAVTRRYNPALGTPFTLALALPVVLVAVSLLFYRGSRTLHWLQLPNVACLAWTAFMGGMAITGQWL